jgi:hypothetical protein
MADSLFSLSFLRPEQFFSTWNQRAIGERKMILHLLRGAFLDLQHGKKHVKARAIAWLYFGDVGYMTCKDACEFLGLDYEWVRSAALGGELGKQKGQPGGQPS